MACKLMSAFKRAKKGSVAVVFAVAAPVVVGFSALGAEVMYWQYTHRLLQSAADAAAFSGAAQLAQGKASSDAVSAASNAAYETGLNASRADNPVINTPPSSGAYSGDTRAVEVTLTDNLPRLFTSIFNSSDTVQISARSVSRTAGARPACVLALNKSAPKAVSFSGAADVELDGCDIASNSIAPDAIDFQGATQVTTECASAVGGIDGGSGNLTLTDCTNPYEGARPFPDPYADLVFPTPDVCGTDGQDLKDKLNAPNGNWTVEPATVTTYCSGPPNILIQSEVFMNPGNYIFDGVNVTINGSAKLTGTDVTIFLTGNAKLTINGGATIDLAAPTDPANPYQGVLIFADPDDSNIEHILNGGSSASFTGALYFPTSDVVYSGDDTVDPNSCLLLIADEIEFTGTSYFGSDCSGLGAQTGQTAQVVLIVE